MPNIDENDENATRYELCKHPIFQYMGAHYWGDYNSDGAAVREQRHRCIDCGHEERDVPDGSVMVGHAPGECPVCDKFAELLPEIEKARWIQLTQKGREE